MSQENGGGTQATSLRVLEAYTRDTARAVARIDYDTMDELVLSSGDVIEIKGNRTTVARALPLYPSDEGKGIIRFDHICRENAGVSIGNSITIRKIKSAPAEKVIVTPLEAIPPIDEHYLADALESVPVVVGDKVSIPYFGGNLYFKVVRVTPSGGAVIVTQKTVFAVSENQGGILVNIEEYVGQEPEMDRAFVPAGDIEAAKARSATHSYLGLRLELSCGNMTEKIDYQKKLTASEVGQVAHLARKYKGIAQAMVEETNKGLTDNVTDAAVLAHEEKAADGEKLLREVMHDLKYAIVMKWADAKVG